MTPNGCVLRSARAGDEPLLGRLNAAVQERHVRERPDFFRQPQPEEVASWFASVLEQPSTRCWIAELDSEPVGYLLMSEHRRDESTFRRARHWHEIDQVAVEPPFRGRGIGRALLQAALAAAAATGAEQVEIASWSFNTQAHALFRRCGFASRLLRFDTDLRVYDDA